jgi:hypothetical protein
LLVGSAPDASAGPRPSASLGEFADEDFFALVKSLECQAGLPDAISQGES